MSHSQPVLEVYVGAMRQEAQGILSVELRRADGKDLPPFTAGAHIVVELATGLARSYSLTNAQHERHRYVIAVNRDRASRGASRYVHEVLRVGHALRISEPRNNFELVESAPQSVFIAGGIGITPLWCMIQRLEKLEKPWQLYYAARSRGATAYLADLLALEARRPGRVHFHFDDEHASTVFDMPSAVAHTSPLAHLYCCGPGPMLGAFEAAVHDRPPEQVHLEYFSAQALASGTDTGFTVVLARSGKRIHVAPGVTILDALLAQQVDVSYSCKEGVCGTCEVGVIAGEPEHRDVVLSDAEKQANKSMMICCSRALSGELILDL